MATFKNMLNYAARIFARESGPHARNYFKKPAVTVLVTRLERRWYRGSNRDTRKREIVQQNKLKNRLPRRDMVFDKKRFLFENFHKELFCFQKRMGLEFNNEDYLKAAFVHPSFLARIQTKEDIPQFALQNGGLLQELQNLKQSPDRLALFGLTQTATIITANVFSAFPFLPSKLIEEICDALSSRETVTRLAENLGIPELIVIEHDIDDIDIEKHLPFSKGDVICDTLFALMGAIHHDLGYEELVKFINDFIMPFVDDENFRNQIKIKKPKVIATQLASLAGYQDKVEPRLLFNTSNEAEAPLYVVGVFSGNENLGEGASNTLHKAEVAAFENAIHNFMWMKDSKGRNGKIEQSL